MTRIFATNKLNYKLIGRYMLNHITSECVAHGLETPTHRSETCSCSKFPKISNKHVCRSA